PPRPLTCCGPRHHRVGRRPPTGPSTTSGQRDGGAAVWRWRPALGRCRAPHRRRAAYRSRSPSDGVKYLPAVDQRVLGLKRVGEPVELLEPGIGVVLAVLGVAGNLDGDDVLGHVRAPVRAERGAEDPRADEGAPRLVLAPARQLPFGKTALVLPGL